jgi:hypothetical protein
MIGKQRAQGRCRTANRYFFAHQTPPELPESLRIKTRLIRTLKSVVLQPGGREFLPNCPKRQ